MTNINNDIVLKKHIFIPVSLAQLVGNIAYYM